VQQPDQAHHACRDIVFGDFLHNYSSLHPLIADAVQYIKEI
jgi:hypothetical protein